MTEDSQHRRIYTEGMEINTGNENDKGEHHLMDSNYSRNSTIEDVKKNKSTDNIPANQIEKYNSKEFLCRDHESDEDGLDVDVTRTPCESIEEVTNAQPNSSKGGGMTSQERHDKFDVLSVVIQKLTELVKSSEGSCPHASDSAKSGNSSGTNTPLTLPEEKKKTRGKRQNKTHLYKCPSCPCLFAIRKRDLKRGRKILCACCEKLKQAKIAARKPTDKTPPQVVPLESWKVVCDICTHWVSDYTALLYHLASHPGVWIFKCKLCDFVTTKQASIESHQLTHQPEEVQPKLINGREVKKNNFICSVCNTFSTDDFAKMDKHLKTHDQLKLLVLKCSVCGYTCRSEEVLRYHMVTHLLESNAAEAAKSGDASRNQENMPFKCSICGYGCDKLSTLKSHSWRHAGEQSCSYPVEESSDHEEPVKDPKEQTPTDSPDQITEASTSREISNVGEEKDNNLEDDDLSRLAIGCCGPKGQACCSKEASDKCHCESFDVPPAQQPVLKVFFKEIVSKPTDIVINEKSRKETDVPSNRAEQEGVTKTSKVEGGRSLSPENGIVLSGGSDADEESPEDEVKEVLEECSSLISHICNKAGQNPATQEESNLDSHPLPDDGKQLHEAISCKISVQVPASSEGGEPTCVVQSSTNKAVTHQETAMNAENDGNILVITENMNINCTGSVVEVTTSDEAHHTVSDQIPLGEEGQVKPALKRSLTQAVDEGPSAKRQEFTNAADSGKDKLDDPRHASGKVSDHDMDTYRHGQMSSEKLHCPFCNTFLPDFKNLKRHLLEHCREQVLSKCQKCPAKFSTEVLLAKHQEGHGNGLLEGSSSAKTGTGYVAEPCIAGSKSSNRRCSVCDRKFRTKASLYLHEQKCTSDKNTFSCFECDFLGTKDQLRKHISENHQKPFKCALCDYMSATPSGVKNHMKFHAVDKRYKCPWCDFSGAYPQSLKSHLKMHASCSDEIKVPCEQYRCNFCGYVSCHLPSMKSHMWRHARDPGFDYNARLDEIIKDATPVVPKNVIAVEQNGLTRITPPQNTAQRELTREPIKPQSTKGTKENQKLNSVARVQVLIFKCTQCGFQSSMRDSLVEHLRGHLVSDDKGLKLG